MNKRTKRLNLILCILAFIIMVSYMLFVDGEDVLNALGKIKASFLWLALLFMLVYWFLEAASLHIIMKSIHKPQKFKDTLVVSVIGQYFNCITPFASGGQPIQAYYLMRYGATLGASMTALLSKFIVYQFVLTVYSLVLLVLRFNYFTTKLSALMALTIIGFIINLAVIIALLTLAFFKKAAVKIAHFIVRLLAKIRIIRNLEQRLKFIDEEIDVYYENFIFLKKQPVLIIKTCLLTIIQLTVYFSISYIIYLGLGLKGADFFTILSCQAYVLMISSFVPLPGALGAAEGSYGAFFGTIFGGFVTFSTFIWRFLTFYFPIIVGLIVTLFIDKKDKKEKVK